MEEQQLPGQRPYINKDLILRERLAIERTDLAIDRTLLAFVRTALYFSIAGMTVKSLLEISYGWWIEIVFCILSVLVLIIGLLIFIRKKKKLKASKIHIGGFRDELDMG